MSSALSEFWQKLTVVSPSSWLLIAVVSLNSLLLLTAFLGQHYFGIDVVTTLTYPPVDGHCNVATEGIGNHCFSDYSIFSTLALSSDPWSFDPSNFVNYLAGGLLPHWIFGGIGSLFGSARLGLIPYLVVLCATIMVPAVWAAWGRRPEQQVIILSLLGLLSIPGLTLLDRGNTLAFAIPGMLFFLVGLSRDSPTMVAVSITAATLVKPQFALLLIAVIVLRRWKTALWSLIGVVASNSIAYLVWPKDFPHTVFQSISQALTFGSTYIGSITVERAQTVSFARALYASGEWIAQLLGREVPVSMLLVAASTGGLVVAASLMALLFFTGRRMPPVLLASFVLAIASMTLTTSYVYYAVFALPIAAVILKNPAEPLKLREHTLGGSLDGLPKSLAVNVSLGLIVSSLAMTVSRVIVPLESSLYADQWQTSATFIPIAWTVTIVVTSLAFAIQKRKPVATPR